MALNGKTIGLALSGGGYRATLFGLGSLWRLNEAKLLGKLDRVTSVSGGSILAGVLGHRWSRLQFADGEATNFRTEINDPVRKFCGDSIDVAVTIKGFLTPGKTAGDYLADAYEKALFGKATVKDLPNAKAGAGPMFIFYATNMQTGRSFRFRQDMLADWMLGTCSDAVVPLARAVAASSAFPPIFSPVIFNTDPAAWKDGTDMPLLESLRKRIVLADGGVYDNMGLESIMGHVDIALVSDAGAPFEVEERPAEDDIFQLGRVRDILIDQTRALRKRWLISEFEAGRARGGYWGVDTAIDAYAAPQAIVKDSALTRTLEKIPTRLKAFDATLQGHLINWGYALCDAALRTRAALDLPSAAGWPVPEQPLS